MTPRTKEQNEEIRLQRLTQIRKAAAEVFLNKGPLLEIRDVAAQAGLGYGTVYHYYGNKGDLLNDLLWDALERAEEWWKDPLKSRHKAQSDGNAGLAVIPASDTGHKGDGDFQRRGQAAATAAKQSPVAVAGICLLQLWAEDHALYLLHKLAVEDFSWLPEARAALLSAAFRRQILTPLAMLLRTGRSANGTASSGGNPEAEPPDWLQYAEMLLAALVGCASLSLRRGMLREEARDIVLLLKL
ncbi:TetR family transcriptional regulator [Paenibacillus yonginensis]|uniref:TetR family transcriptional regulator n=1 Tax=Paenibacillus yonginensis TaxID=1462996 RepID=A0A1B1MZ95_9BACL|nr:helix-turn-helix domain-containing protein [Paenibacillus yonginensis]ANS74500.1 TetR family transcriptional regulator [Paenibacillus yonginensis]